MPKDLYSSLNQALSMIRKPLLAALSQFRLTPEQWEIIQLLQDGEKSQREIIKLTMKDKGNISRILSRLKKNGWVVEIKSRPMKYAIDKSCEEVENCLKPFYKNMNELSKTKGFDIVDCLGALLKEL